MEGWDKVVPQFLREMLSSLDPKARDAVEELRLREGFPLAVVQAGEEWTHPAWRGRPLTEEALRRVLETAGRGSVHTVLDQLRSWGTDCAGVGSQVSRADPARWEKLGSQWTRLFSTVPVEISVEVSLGDR